MQHKFVEFMPSELEENTLYVSLEYGTARHKCFCGCGELVVTPISPTDWKLTFDGESISIHPSIGSWNLPCRSHYFIKNSNIIWAGDWSDKQVKQSKSEDQKLKEEFYKKPPTRFLDKILGFFKLK